MLNPSDWQLRIFNQIISWRFDWSLPHHANNRFRGREVKGSSIGILTDRSLVKMVILLLCDNSALSESTNSH